MFPVLKLTKKKNVEDTLTFLLLCEEHPNYISRMLKLFQLLGKFCFLTHDGIYKSQIQIEFLISEATPFVKFRNIWSQSLETSVSNIRDVTTVLDWKMLFKLWLMDSKVEQIFKIRLQKKRLISEPFLPLLHLDAVLRHGPLLLTDGRSSTLRPVFQWWRWGWRLYPVLEWSSRSW